MGKLAGIDVNILDKINIFLTYKTACKYHICKAAREFWTKKYDRKPLLLSNKNFSIFSRQEDCTYDADSAGKINVFGWVEVLLYCDGHRIPDLDILAGDYTSIKFERAVKAFFLLRKSPRTFFRLGGKMLRISPWTCE